MHTDCTASGLTPAVNCNWLIVVLELELERFTVCEGTKELKYLELGLF